MLGVDIGTTNIKAALYTYSGKEVFVKSATYSLHTDAFGAATQSAHEMKEKTFQVIRESTAECSKNGWKISFLSFSAAMHSLMAVDDKGEPISPVFTLGDRQAEPYLADLKDEASPSLYHNTGTPLHPMTPFVKLYGLKITSHEMMQKAHKFIGVKSFILYQFFGVYVTDYSIANATGLWNMHTLSWDKEALKIVGISENKLPKLVPTTEVLRGMNENAALVSGLDQKTPIVIGASDGCLANLGVNAIEQGQVALSIGTSGAIRTVTDRPLTDKNERTFCYALTEDLWVIGGPVNNGGVVMDWAMHRFVETEDSERIVESKESRFEQMMHQVDSAPLGADQLFFHPYLVGERSPVWRSDAKGSFFGLDIHHQNEHMLRAVLEGINLNLYAVYIAIAEVIGADAKEILVTGGFTKSDTWLQMIADIFGVELVITEVFENACLGAAVLGLYALGENKDFSDLNQMIPIGKRIKPTKTHHQFYQRHFEKYQKLNEYYLKMFEVLDR